MTFLEIAARRSALTRPIVHEAFTELVATAFLLSWQRRPYFVCESLDDALAWARKRIRESNPRGTS